MEVKLDKELYEKLSPVLETKLIQLKRCDFLDISKKDLWNYLKNTKWINYNSIYINAWSFSFRSRIWSLYYSQKVWRWH